MKKVLLILSLFLCSEILLAQAPAYPWAVKAGRAGNEVESSVCTDISGNLYVTGKFSSDTIYFGAIMVVKPVSDMENVYLAKYDSLGNALWVRVGTGIAYNFASEVICDASGNVYITGYYNNGSITFGGTTLTNAGGTNFSGDIYLVKYDSFGTMAWAKKFGGVNDDISRDLAIDVSGNIILSGTFASPNIVFGATTIFNTTPTSPAEDVFVTKLDNSGNPIWAKMALGSQADRNFGVSSDPLGNVYITGIFSSPTATFGAFTLTNFTALGYWNTFVVKYNSSGTELWAKSFGAATDDVVGISISVDKFGNSYIGGYFLASSVVFGTTTLTNASTITEDAFLLKLWPSGNVSWAKKFGNIGPEQINELVSDSLGNVTVSGGYAYGPEVIGTTSLAYTAGSSGGSSDAFIARYDSLGTVLWATKIGGTRSEAISGICIKENYVFVTGSYDSSPITFIPPTLTNYSLPGTSADMFLAKLCVLPIRPLIISGPSLVCSGSTHTYSVSPVAGAISYTWTLPGGWTGTSTTNSITTTVSATGGTISVTANNICGSSTPRTLAVTVSAAVPATPGTISGSASVCIGSFNFYLITAVPGATSYTWTLPVGWTGTSTTNSITINATGGSGILSVIANNGCGSSAPQSLSILVNPLPIVTYTQSPSLVCVTAVTVPLTMGTPAGGIFNGISVLGSNFYAAAAGLGTYVISYSYTDANSCIGSATSTIVVDACLDIEQAGIDSGLIISPNPFTEQTTITFSDEQKNITIKIVDVLGKEIKTFNFSGKELIIEKGEMRKGIYFVQVIDENKNGIIKKIIVQ